MSRAVRHRYQGREQGPVQQEGEVVDRRRLGRYWGITVTAGEIASRCEPGQFVNVAVDIAGTLLRRPFSLAGASPSGPVAGTIDIVVDAHGPGTDALGRVRTGDRLTLMGPLGRPFPMPQRRVSAVLVGGGYGAAPLYFLGNRLRSAGHKIGFVIGAADQSRIVDPIVPKRMATLTMFTTEDGSMGEQGRVTDVLRKALATTDAEVVYACGPNGMLAAVSAVSESLGIPCQVAVEEHMACGVGVCMTCVMPIRDRRGEVHNRRVCLDGPVFTSTRIAWQESRYVAPAGSDDDGGGSDPVDAPARTPTPTTPAVGNSTTPAPAPAGRADRSPPGADPTSSDTERPPGTKRTSDRPSSDRQSPDRPSSDRQSPDRPSSDRQSSDRRSGDRTPPGEARGPGDGSWIGG